MQNKIKNIKQRIEDNYQELYYEYGEDCQLANPILEMIDLLLSVNAPDDKIKLYLRNINSSIIIIEEKLQRVEKKIKESNINNPRHIKREDNFLTRDEANER